MQELHIVTVASEQSLYFPYLKESCKRNGKILTVLGLGKKWTGLNSKFSYIISHMKSLPPEDLICFVDGYDVICTRHLSELPKQFDYFQKKYNIEMILADNVYIHTMMYLSHMLYYKKCKQRYINSGTYIGKVKHVLSVIEKAYSLNKEHNTSDQQLLTKYCSQNQHLFYIDTDNHFFLTINYPGNDIRPYVNIKNKRLTYKNKQPFFIHANGNGFLDNILCDLGYHVTNVEERHHQMYTQIRKKTQFHISQYIKNNLFLLIILVFILIYLTQLALSSRDVYASSMI